MNLNTSFLSFFMFYLKDFYKALKNNFSFAFFNYFLLYLVYFIYSQLISILLIKTDLYYSEYNLTIITILMLPLIYFGFVYFVHILNKFYNLKHSNKKLYYFGFKYFILFLLFGIIPYSLMSLLDLNVFVNDLIVVIVSFFLMYFIFNIPKVIFEKSLSKTLKNLLKEIINYKQWLKYIIIILFLIVVIYLLYLITPYFNYLLDLLIIPFVICIFLHFGYK